MHLLWDKHLLPHITLFYMLLSLTGSFTCNNFELQWLLWGTLDMNKIVHLRDALEHKGKKQQEIILSA